MKRDMDLIRRILASVEEKPALEPLEGLHYPGEYTDPTIVAHVKLLADAGWIEGGVVDYIGMDMPHVRIERLTNAGHDFIGFARNDTTWKKARARVKKLSMSISLDLFLDVLKSVARHQLGL